MQGEVGIAPDLTTLGKIIGGGFAVGAVAGRAEILDLSTPDRGPARHACRHVQRQPDDGGGRARDDGGADAARRSSSSPSSARYARDGLAAAARGLPLQVTGAGSLFKVTATPRALRDYRDAATADKRWEALCSLALLNEGFVLTPSMSGCVSTVTHARRSRRDASPRSATSSRREAR